MSKYIRFIGQGSKYSNVYRFILFDENMMSVFSWLCKITNVVVVAQY